MWRTAQWTPVLCASFFFLLTYLYRCTPNSQTRFWDRRFLDTRAVVRKNWRCGLGWFESSTRENSCQFARLTSRHTLAGPVENDWHLLDPGHRLWMLQAYCGGYHGAFVPLISLTPQSLYRYTWSPWLRGILTQTCVGCPSINKIGGFKSQLYALPSATFKQVCQTTPRITTYTYILQRPNWSVNARGILQLRSNVLVSEELAYT